jgi:hypothetical protein
MPRPLIERNRRLHDIRDRSDAGYHSADSLDPRRIMAPLCQLRVSAIEDFPRDRSQLFASRYVFLSGQVLNATRKNFAS